MLAIVPFFHAFGLFLGITAIINKVKLVVMKQFNDDVFLSAIERNKINALPLAPPLAIFLAKTPKLEKYDISSVKKLGCGAAPLSKEVESILKKR